MSGEAIAPRPLICSWPSGASSWPRVSSELLVSFWVLRKYTLPGSRRGFAKGGSIRTRFAYVNFSDACMRRFRVCSFRLGSSENQSTTAPGSGSKSNASFPQNNASIAAAAITVFPAPVVAVSEKDEISCFSGLL
jgi:hypothetical protein